MNRALSREETKLITRRRLLDGAALVLRKEGFEKLTTSRVAREAGVAQPTFYVHFRDMNELLHTLAEENLGQIRNPLREARLAIQSAASDDPLRETFRLPLRALTAQPELFRLWIQELHRPGSPLGRMAREMQDEMRRDLVEDLIALGAPASTPVKRQRLEIVADGLIALTQNLALSYIEGRHPDLEQIVDVLVSFTVGVLPPPLSAA
jgi:AcrR family transcriptional regulator